MGREVHFVIAVDVDTKKVYIDDDTYSVQFTREEGYWDTEKEDWFVDEDNLLYNQALEILNSKAQLEKE